MRIMFSLLLFCLVSACAYTPDGEPKIIISITSWPIKLHPTTAYNGDFEIHYSIKNIGSSDNTKLKREYIWVISVPIVMKKTNNEMIEKNIKNENIVLQISCPKTGDSFSDLQVFNVKDIFGSNFMQDTNLIFIKEIIPKEPIITLEKLPPSSI